MSSIDKMLLSITSPDPKGVPVVCMHQRSAVYCERTDRHTLTAESIYSFNVQEVQMLLLYKVPIEFHIFNCRMSENIYILFTSILSNRVLLRGRSCL